MKKLAKLTTAIAITSFAASAMFGTVYAAGGPGGNPPSGSPGGGANTMTYDYSGPLSGILTTDASEGTYSTSTADENVVLATDGQTLAISGVTLNKSGDDNDGDSCNFYGINSIALAVGEGTTLYLSDATLNADSTGSNGIFSTDNATVYVKDVTITTSSDNSRGLDATYGGTIVADGLAISTQGDHCAALATDRGGGQISVTNSELSTTGSGSPLLYSTGDIEIDNITGTTSGSQIAGMEGLNTILIYNSDLISTNTSTTGSDPVANAIILYQSTSGDAEASTGETATFQAVNSSLSSSIESGSFFYITNTSVDVLLQNTTLNYDASKANLLQIEGNDANNWGSAGSNGATVTFTAIGEELTGDISVDTISSLNLYLTGGTTYTGAMTITANANGSSSTAPIVVNLDATSTWVVTEDSTISELHAADGATIVDESGRSVTIVTGGETVVSGDSYLTITVTGTYDNIPGTAGTVSASYIARDAFDSYYATETSFGTNGEVSGEAAEEDAESQDGETASGESEDDVTDTESALEDAAESKDSTEEAASEGAMEEADSASEASATEASNAAATANVVSETASTTSSPLPWIIGGCAAALILVVIVIHVSRRNRK